MKTTESLHIEIYSKTGKRLLAGTIKRIGCFHIIPDFTIDLMDGQHIEISSEAARIISEAYQKIYPESVLCETSAARKHLIKVAEDIKKERQCA